MNNPRRLVALTGIGMLFAVVVFTPAPVRADPDLSFVYSTLTGSYTSTTATADFTPTPAVSDIDQVFRTAHGVGAVVVDYDGDTIEGLESGIRSDHSGLDEFSGGLTGLTLTSDKGELNGLVGSFSTDDFLGFESLLSANTNVSKTDDSFSPGLSGGHPGTHAPAPGAVVLGAMGLGLVGWMKRRAV